MNNKLLKNGFYNAAAGAIRIGLALLIIPVLIRILGVKEYGTWALASAVVELIALSGNGISVTTTVFGSRDLSTEDTDSLCKTLTVIIGGTLILATLAAVSLCISSEVIVRLFPQLGTTQGSAVVKAFQIGGLVVWSRLMQQVLIGIEQAYQKYGLLNILNTLQWLLLSLGLAIVAYLGGRTVELMQWLAVTSFVMLLSHLWVVISLVHSIRLRPIWEIEKVLAIAHHSLITWLICLGSVAFGRGDRLIIASFLGSESLGIYAAITEATSAMNSFAALPVQPIVPLLSNQSTEKCVSTPKFKQQIKQSFEINALVALGFAAWLFIFAPFIMQFLLTNSATVNNIVAFRIAVVIYALCSLSAVGFNILLALNVNLCMLLQLASGIFSLALITIGAINFGLLGAIIGNVGFLVTWLMILFGIKHLNLSTYLWVKSLAFPLLWFLSCISLNILISSNFSMEVILAIIQTIILIGWFILVQKQKIKFMLHNFRL